jgi:hypothetical protein
MSVVTTPYEVVPGTDLVLDFTRYTGQQLLTLVGVSGGVIRISYKGPKSGDIDAMAATGTDVQAALEVLSSIKAGNIEVTGVAGGPWTLTPKLLLSPSDFIQNPVIVDLAGSTGDPNRRAEVTTPTQDVSTGYTYEFQARDIPGETDPDIIIDATHTTDGTIDLSDAANGRIRVVVNAAKTNVLDFAVDKGMAAGFVLVETFAGLHEPLVQGRLHLQPAYYRIP